MYKTTLEGVAFEWQYNTLTTDIIEEAAASLINATNSEFMKFALTEDSGNIEALIKRSFKNLFLLFIKSSNPVPNSYFYDSNDNESGKSCGFTTIFAREKSGNIIFNTSRLDVVEPLCSRFIVENSLQYWAKQNALAPLEALFTEQLATTTAQIRSNLFQMRPSYNKESFTITNIE